MGESALSALAADVAALEGDADLLAPDAFGPRARALEAVEDGIIRALEASTVRGARALRRRARALLARLARADVALFTRLRTDIRAGRLQGEALRRELLRLAPPSEDGANAGGYDALDALIAGILLDESPPATVRPELHGWDPEMVPYQPTPARTLFELAAHLRPAATEVLFDLGAGLGLACVLVHLLTDVRAVGIEIDPALCAYGRRMVARLGLRRVTFVRGDARSADLSGGTFFYLYTPFTGALLDAVLARLRRLATGRSIRIASYGPCTAVVARQAWLAPEGREHHNPERLAVFTSR